MAALDLLVARKFLNYDNIDSNSNAGPLTAENILASQSDAAEPSSPILNSLKNSPSPSRKLFLDSLNSLKIKESYPKMMVYLGLFAPVPKRLAFVVVKVAVKFMATAWPSLYMPMPSDSFSNFPFSKVVLLYSKIPGDSDYDPPGLEICGVFSGFLFPPPFRLLLQTYRPVSLLLLALQETIPIAFCPFLLNYFTSGETVVKSLTCDGLDLHAIDHPVPAPTLEEVLVPALPSLEVNNSVSLQAPEKLPVIPTWTPWLLAGLVLMKLNVYFP
ncbi:hypothetical protein DSO57_1038694 [Entomophthora muscae]|uniref:Uncharacterized protein n=1 Tax=Entomophthora muscae TaxID=34485 RepID=A0ACC2T9N2_9FUNG|nr:hypothetical protein DSO57_1038694 [Entomophthora muscae]